MAGQIGVCTCLFAMNRLVFLKIPDIAPRTLPWHMEVALIGAILIVLGHHAQKNKVFKLMEKNIVVWFGVLIAGILAGYFNRGKVGLAWNRVGSPFLFLVCSCAVSLDMVILSGKILKTVVGHFLGFCGKSTMVFMGFNYYFNSLSAKVWKKIPILNNYKYVWWIKSIVAIILLVLTSYLWKLMLRKYYRLREKRYAV